MIRYRLENGKYLGIAYYTNVKNIKLLKENLDSFFKDKSPVLIQSKIIVGPFQILVAANIACTSDANSSMKTKSLATEILFNLSSTNEISKALEDTSVGDQDEEMIVTIVSKFPDVPELTIFRDKCIKADESDITDLTNNLDENFIRSYYKISEAEKTYSDLLKSVVGKIICKNILFKT